MNNKTKVELIWAEIFRRYINDRFIWDYQEVSGKIFRILENYPDIDVVLVSRNGRENLFLQLTRDLNWSKTKESEKLYSQIKRTLGEFDDLKDTSTGKEKPILDAGEINFAINSKQKKYEEQKKNISNVILLIQGGGIPYSEMGLWSNDVHIPQNTFRAIYYVSPKSLKNGQFVFPLLDGLKNI